MQYVTIINYFKSLGFGHSGILSVQEGDFDAILALEQRGMDTPLLWIETPEIDYTGGVDHMMEQFGVFITVAMPSTDTLDQIYEKAKTAEIMSQLIRQMGEDVDNDRIRGMINFSSIRCDAVELLTGNLIGWRARIPVKQSICAPAEEIPLVSWPQMVYTSSNRRIILLPNESLTGLEHYFEVWIDGNMTEVTDSFVELAEGIGSAYVEVVFKAKGGNIVSGIHIPDIDIDASSQPYSFNPFIKAIPGT